VNAFMSANILLPNVAAMEAWAVIACDQFTSQPEYWERVRKNAEGHPSAINLILPESELGGSREEVLIGTINETMKEYLGGDCFRELPDALIYVERTLLNGSVRKGLVGMVDLEAYDFCPGSISAIRATEKTVVERIPPRVRVRRDAPVELPHIILLCDDQEKVLIEPIISRKDQMEKLYDLDLMEGGGHITGWLVEPEQAAAFEQRLTDYTDTVDEKYKGLKGVPMVFAVGDGNHSLATAKTCYEELKAAHPGEDLSCHPARFALVELENIHDEAQVFEPIHRIVRGVDPEKLLGALAEENTTSEGYAVQWYIGEKTGTVILDPAKSQLAVGVLQTFLDSYLAANGGEIDYIHGDDTVKELAEQENSIGFLLPAIGKSQLFRSVIADGALPRKTFSMGHAQEKRYYLEARRIK